MTKNIFEPSAREGDLKVDYVALPVAGQLTKQTGKDLNDSERRIGGTAAVRLYARDPLNTAPFEGLLRDIRTALKSNAQELDELGIHMEAVGAAADLADNAGFVAKVTGERGQIDHQASLTLWLIEQGKTQLAMEASLVNSNNEIKFIITADGSVRVWKIVDVGINESASLSIKLLPDGSYGDDRYQLSLSGQYELFGGVKGESDGASGQARIGGGPKATIIFRSDDAADIAKNVEDIKTVVRGPLDTSISGAKMIGGVLVGPLGHRFASNEAAKIHEQLKRVGEAEKALYRDYDAVEIGARYHGSAEAEGSMKKPKEVTIFGKPLLATSGYTGDINIDGTVEVIYHHERHDSNGGDKVIIRGTTAIDGSLGEFESLSVGKEGTANAEARASASVTRKHTMIQQIEYDVDTEQVKVTLIAEGQAGVELEQSVAAGTKNKGPTGKIGHTTDATIGARVTVVFEPKDGDAGDVLEALKSGDYEQAIEAAGGTKVEVSKVTTASESVSVSGGVPNVAGGSVSITGKVVDVEQISLWEPEEPPAPPATEPPVPEITIEDPPPQTIPEPPEPKGKGSFDMSDDDMVNDQMTPRVPAGVR